MKWGRILAVARKDWREAMRGMWMIAPSVFLVAYFGIALPAILIYAAKATGEVLIPVNIPFPIRVEGDLARSLYFAFQAVVPLIFLVIPLAVSTILAADGFAGERERGTLELLLAAPLDERELLLGKVLAALVPGVASSWTTFLLMVPTVNLLSSDIFNGPWFPPGPEWIIVVFLISPLYSFLAVAITCALSSKVRSVKEAQQGAGILILPLLIVVLAQVFWGVAVNAEALVLASLLLGGIDAIMILALPRLFHGIRYLLE
ncbi:MAG: ABC transporter permease subunit [Candidatus Korarchaeota archaeon]|nr:ABC transporter permease subunit [Candidatus Korarchaeota archaeon]